MTDSDLQFGRLAVGQGLATPEQVQECLRALAALAATGVSPLPTLGELLVQKGYLSPRDLQRSLTVSQEAAAPVGERFGKYVKTAKLGEGGMGEVWKAWDAELRRWVALKFLKHDDAEDLARFKREAQTAGQLNHPNIAAIHEVGEIAGKRFIAMQFVEGQTLASFPRNDRKLLVELVRDAALAVHAAHEQGVVHRDLKPENLMVEGNPKPRAKTTRRVPGAPRASGLRVYVMDFGLAKPMKVESGLSQSGLIVGTPSYMSPEQAGGRIHEVGPRSDVYSLGATLYELLADRPPFKGGDVMKLLRKIAEEDPRPPECERDLRTIVMKCLEKDPARRYETALELAEDLTSYLGGEAILAHPPSFLYRLGKFVARRRAVVVLAFIAAVGVSLGSTVGISQWRKARAAAKAREEEEAVRRRAEAMKREIELFMPVERELDVLAMRFYQPDFRLGDQEFSEYEALEARIHAQMNETGTSARGWWLIGRIREVVQSWRADEAYNEALKLDPTHGPSLLRKGRRYLDRGLQLRRTADDWDNDSGASEFIRQGQRLIQQAGTGLELEEDLGRAYATVIDRWGKKDFSATAMMEKWKSRPFVEEFLLLEAVSRLETGPADESIRRLPSYARSYLLRAWLRAEIGDFAGAIEDTSTAVRLNPRFIEALNNRGIARMELDDFNGAIEDFSSALRIHPKLVIALCNRARARWIPFWRSNQTGDIAQLDLAVADCSEAIRIEPSAATYCNRAFACGTKGAVLASLERAAEAMTEMDRALSDHLEAIRIRPRYAGSYVNRALTRNRRAMVLSGMGRKPDADRELDEGIKDLDIAFEMAPPSAGWRSYRATMRRSRGDARGAIEDCTKALAIDPRNSDAYNTRGAARSDVGDWEGALADFEESIQCRPSSPAHSNRGAIRRQRGETRAAIEDFTKAIELDRGNSGYHCERGDAHQTEAVFLRASGRLSEAEAELRLAFSDQSEAIRLKPRNAVYWAKRGSVRNDQRDYDRAIDDCTHAIALDSRLAFAYAIRANALGGKGDRVKALEDNTKALALDPRLSFAYAQRASLYLLNGKFDEAIRDCDQALALDPRLAMAYAARGTGRFSKRDYDGAIDDLTKALDLDPRRYEAWINRALASSAKGDHDKAIRDCDRGIESDPGRETGYVARAICRYAKGDYDGSIADCTKALEINPRSADAYYNRAAAKYGKRDTQAALADDEKALEVAPTDWPYRTQVEEVLRRLKSKP